MKLTVKKTPNTGRLNIELVHDQLKKPLTIDLTQTQVEMVVQVLRGAVNAESFSISVEV